MAQLHLGVIGATPKDTSAVCQSTHTILTG
jgi:hypothetical protein